MKLSLIESEQVYSKKNYKIYKQIGCFVLLVIFFLILSNIAAKNLK